MRLTAKTDLEAPIGPAYNALVDHPSWERDAIERGLRVERVAGATHLGPGAGWEVHLPFRGKLVKLQLLVVEERPSDEVRYSYLSNAFEGEITLGVTPLSLRRTRLTMGIEIHPRTIMARVLMNTLRLAKGRAQARLEQRLAQMARQIERRCQAGQ